MDKSHCSKDDTTLGDKSETQCNMSGMVPEDKFMSSNVKKDVMMRWVLMLRVIG